MYTYLDIAEFSNFPDRIARIDVRSPAEYNRGHIPGAINIPLFDDQERAEVGKIFKKNGQKDAILLGLSFAGQKLRQLAELGLQFAPDKELLVYCWRGGMRSASMSWLFAQCGIRCKVLKGGYKSFRRYASEYFEKPYRFIVIGGMTGTGKSDILDVISEKGYQVLKLERIAHHKGSVFGSLGQQPQNGNEQFENEMFNELRKYDVHKPVFIEDESRNIGKNTIPKGIFERMANSPIIVIEMEISLRIKRLIKEYGYHDQASLIRSIEKIFKRLGGLNTREAIQSIERKDMETAAMLILTYYDKTYTYGLSRKRNPIILSYKAKTEDPARNAAEILELVRNSTLM